MFKRIAFSVLWLGFFSWGASSGAMFVLERFSPAGLDSSPGSPSQKSSVKPARVMFKSFKGVIEVSGHQTASKPGLTNYVATIHGTIIFEGKNDQVVTSSGTLTYGMSGWNTPNCLHEASGTVEAYFAPLVSTMVSASDAGKKLTKEQKNLFKGADFFLDAIAMVELIMTSYKINCGGYVVPQPFFTWQEPDFKPLFIPGNFVPFKFTGVIDEWKCDLDFTIKSFDGRSK